MNRCNKCRRILPPRAFRIRKGKHISQCIECEREAALKYYHEHRTPEVLEHKRQYMQAQWETNRDHLVAMMKSRPYYNTPEYRSSPEKRKARYTLDNAVARGKIIRPTICPECHREARIEAHHDDYSKPLDVKWFCRRCHRKYEREHR